MNYKWIFHLCINQAWYNFQDYPKTMDHPMRKYITKIKSLPSPLKIATFLRTFFQSLTLTNSLLKIRHWNTILTQHILLSLNWMFTLSLIALGIIGGAICLSVQLPHTGYLIFSLLPITGILISPYFSQLIRLKLKLPFQAPEKVILLLLSCLLITLSLDKQDDKQLESLLADFLLDEKSSVQTEKSQDQGERKEFEEKQRRIIEFQNNQDQKMAEWQALFEHEDYAKVIEKAKPYQDFDLKVKEWVEKAEKRLHDKERNRALREGPQLLKDGKFIEAYHLTSRFEEVSELQEIAEKSKDQREKKIEQLRSLYETGNYDQLIEQSQPYLDLDCQIKWLVNAAERVKSRKKELEEIKNALEQVEKLRRAGEPHKALDYAKQLKYPQLQEKAEAIKLEINTAEETQILNRLKKISDFNIPQNLHEYGRLTSLFPENLEYKKKYDYYKRRLDELAERSNGSIREEDFNDKWPFTISQGELTCTPPGILTLWVNEKFYAVNELAISQGYSRLDEILKHPGADTTFIIAKGLSLCE